jgi:hypothetical protein
VIKVVANVIANRDVVATAIMMSGDLTVIGTNQPAAASTAWRPRQSQPETTGEYVT